MNNFQTFKFYNKDKKRLSIFYRNNTIVTVACNPKDQFSRAKGKQLFDTVGANKERFEVGEMTQRTFIEWCENKYRKQYESEFSFSEVVDIVSVKTKNKLSGSVLTLKFLA